VHPLTLSFLVQTTRPIRNQMSYTTRSCSSLKPSFSGSKQKAPSKPNVQNKTILTILKSFLSWFKDKLSFVVYTKRSKTNFPFLFIPNVQKHPHLFKTKKAPLPST